jgi:hypothetical protein
VKRVVRYERHRSRAASVALDLRANQLRKVGRTLRRANDSTATSVSRCALRRDIKLNKASRASSVVRCFAAEINDGQPTSRGSLTPAASRGQVAVRGCNEKGCRPMITEKERILEQMEREISAEFAVELPSSLVYHYTDAAGLHGILTSGAVRATHFTHLNDRRELLEGEDLVREVAKEMQQKLPSEGQNALLEDFLTGYDDMVLSRIAKDVYVTSFSEVGDDLAQWRAYGGRGAGYAIGLQFNLATADVNEAALNRGLGQTMLKVRYDRDEMKSQVSKDLRECFAGIERYIATFHPKVDGKEVFPSGWHSPTAGPLGLPPCLSTIPSPPNGSGVGLRPCRRRHRTTCSRCGLRNVASFRSLSYHLNRARHHRRA